MKISGTNDAWESGTLGESDSHIAIAPDHISEEVDSAIGIKKITLRLPNNIFDYYTELAKANNVPLEVMIQIVLTTYIETYAE